ncbi:hypothetical protein DB345_02840 [Spartobacteria bacterium LR76]|nr:hypothetical protein DB345_02840 [Spartobacteria bacterium LR76]
MEVVLLSICLALLLATIATVVCERRLRRGKRVSIWLVVPAAGVMAFGSVLAVFAMMLGWELSRR